MLKNYGTLLSRDSKVLGSAGEEMQRVRNAVNALNNILNGEMPLIGEHHEVDAAAVNRMLRAAISEVRSACKNYLKEKAPNSKEGKRRRALVENLNETAKAFEAGCNAEKLTFYAEDFLAGHQTGRVTTLLDLLTSPVRQNAASAEEQKDIAAENYAYRSLEEKHAERRAEYQKHFKKCLRNTTMFPM